MKLPKINLNDPTTFRNLVIGGLAAIFVLILISSIFFQSTQQEATPDFDAEAAINVIPYTDKKVIIEVTDSRVTDPETLRQLAGLPKDVEIIVDVPGALQKDNSFKDLEYYSEPGNDIEFPDHYAE
ncbi:MAG: hypothetical protein ACE5DX_03325 [Candidatus Dojkabacteria bacterium]